MEFLLNPEFFQSPPCRLTTTRSTKQPTAVTMGKRKVGALEKIDADL